MNLQELELTAASCQLCDLCKGRVKPVFAKGYRESDILICGMCPGRDENFVGYPFVGKAGKVLDDILYTVFTGETEPHDHVYITNLVKCFVQPGIKLQEEWMDACLPHLIVQIALVKPKVIIGLGKDVCNYLLNVNDSIGRMRERLNSYMGINFICTYHPSFLARGNSKKYFDVVVGDFRKALDFI